MKRFGIGIFLFFIFLHRSGRSEILLHGIKKDFELNIKITAPATGSVILVFYDEFADVVVNSDSVLSTNGVAIFKGKIEYPHLVRIIFKNTEIDRISDPFFIAHGKQQISLIVHPQKSLEVKPESNGPQLEFKNRYSDFMRSVQLKSDRWYRDIDSVSKLASKPAQKEMDSIRNLLEVIIAEQDSSLVKYIKLYPQSYVGFWMLASHFQRRSYKSIYEEGFGFLSPAIRNSASGRKLGNALKRAAELAIGATLPTLEFLDTAGNKYKINYANARYTIIDFWFSYCAPCIEEFREIKKIHDSMMQQDIQLVAVSVDKSHEIPVWKRKLAEEDYPWLQLLDMDGKWATRYNINAFPFNIAVDKEGKIIAKNISTAEIKSNLLQNARN